MKKLGFTLVEILVALGIIGVIAAITLPTLMNNTMSAQIGPKLAKAVAAFEQANAELMRENSIEYLSEEYDSFEDYQNDITRYLKATQTNASQVWNATSSSNSCVATPSLYQIGLLAKDGVEYALYYDPTERRDVPPHQASLAAVIIDINGSSGPNRAGTDLFSFAMYEDGTLKPVGGNNWAEEGDNGCSWRTLCEIGSIPTDAWACAGHVFENNLKVLYK